MSVLDSIIFEREKYGTVMSETECVNLLNSVAWRHRHERWGLSGKTFGNRAQRYDGVECSVDVLQQRPEHPRHDWEGVMVDVLRSAGAGSTPTWNVHGENTQTNRPWTAPIEHREPSGRVVLTTTLGASLFSLVDLYQHERARAEETLTRLRDELGARFVRVMWRKGTGAPGDYWNNDGYYSLVRSNLQQLPVTLMQEAMHFVGSYGLRIAHCIFADNLGASMREQEAFVDGWLQAESAHRDVTEYVEVFNEPAPYGGGHGGDLETLHRHARRLRAGLGPHVLLALGTPGTVHRGGDIEAEVADMYGNCPEANLITVHPSRDTNNPQLMPELSHFAPGKRANGEPIGPDSSVDETKDAQALARNFQETNRAGYEWYVFHAGQLIRPRGQNVWQLAEWADIAAAMKAAAEGQDIPLPRPGGGGGDAVNPYPDEHTWWPQFEAQVVALYQKAFDEGKRGAPELDSAAFRWFARASYDIAAGLTKEASAEKHLTGLAAALGVSR